MFGVYRYLLALLTIFSHFHPIYFGRLNWTGMYGLFGFYVMSGYLMTRTLHEAYGFSREGVGRFLWNRALRVYPAYWCAAILSLLVALAVPETVHRYTQIMGAPTTADGIARNVFVFGMHGESWPRIVTPAWSLNVELCFYLLMACGLSRSRWTVLVWVAAGLAYTVYAVAAGVPFPTRYSTIAAASLPFSLGAAIYFAVRPGGEPRRWALPAVVVFLGADLVAPWLVSDVLLHGFYAALALTCVTVFCLAHVQLRSLPAPLVSLDRWLGDFTYPMFLLHLPVAYVVAAVLSPAARMDQNRLLLVGLPVVHLVAWAVVVLVEHRMQPTRQRIRDRVALRPEPALVPAAAGGPQLAAAVAAGPGLWERAAGFFAPGDASSLRRAAKVVAIRPRSRVSTYGSIPEVESLRGLAIALVFLMHAESMFSGFRALAAPFSPLRAYILGGHTGVSLFFILSGFLLSRPFLVEAAGGARVLRSRFYARRALRIMPLYSIVVVVAAIVCAQSAADLLRGVPFLFFVNSIQGLTTPLPPFSFVWWSLATEAQFYLVLPLLPFVLRSARGRRIGLAVLVGYAIAYVAFATGELKLATLPGQNRLAHSLLGRAPLFACGILAAAAYHWLGERATAWAARRTWLRMGGADVLLLGIMLGLGVLLRQVVYGNYFELESYHPSWHLIEGPLWTAVLLLLLIAPLRAKLVLVNPVLALIGRLSYSIYLVHVPVLTFGLAAIKRNFSWAPAGWSLESAAVCGLLALVCLAISSVTYAAIEQPMMRRRGRMALREAELGAPEVASDAALDAVEQPRRRATG